MKRVTVYIILFQSLTVWGQSFSDYTGDEIREDIQFIYQSIKQIHPNSESLSLENIEELKSSLDNEFYSESDAFFIFNGILKQLNDGHSNVKFSSSRAKVLLRHGTFFPYELEFFDSTAVVIGHINGIAADAIGKEIFKINQIPIKEILNDLSVVAMKDGENNDSLEDWLEEDFWFYFTLYNGYRNSYSVTYIEDGHEVHEIAKARTRMEYVSTGVLDDFRVSPIDFYYEDGVPVLKIHSFEKRDKPWWKRELKSIMNQLEEESTPCLILDLRGNGGGEEQLQNILLETFGIQKSAKYTDEFFRDVNLSEVEGLNKRFIEGVKSFGLKQFVFTKKESETLRSRKYRSSGKEIPSQFSGELLVLVDGATFSCGSDAAAILKENYSSTTVLGTETRGSGKENYAGYFLHLTLPNSGFELRIPRVKYVINTQKYAKDSGVIPDVNIEKAKDDLINGIDTQLRLAVTLARRCKDDQNLLGVKP